MTDTLSSFPPLPTALAVAGVVLVTRYAFKKKESPFPPGPKPRFLIGNALDIPVDKPTRKYLAWSKEFNSSMVGLTALGRRIIVLHSREDAEELFEKRASIHSDRVALATRDMMGWDYNIASFRYDDDWRSHRRICQQNFKAESAPQYYPVQIRKVHDMMASLLDAPERFEDHNKMLSISIPLTTMYGYEVRSLDDPAIVAADKSVELGLKVVTMGGSFVNILPILRYVPWTWTQRITKKVKAFTEEMKRVPLEALLRDMVKGCAIPSLVGNFMERKQTIGATADEERTILNVANTVYSDAADTTISATKTFFYLLTTHPEVQAKAHAELDRVFGSSPRLPTFEDRASLPYIEAIYREVLRWYPPIVMGLPHVSTEDDWYKGYFIPKGTIIYANIWAINREEGKYGSDPYAFNPDRFMDENGHLNDDDRILAYGFGRRGCVGKHVASSTLWLMMVTTLACFQLRKKKDENGKEVEIDDEYDERGLLGHKTPYECDISPRSNEWRELIEVARSQGYKF